MYLPSFLGLITPHPPSFLCNIICSTKVYAFGVFTFRNIYPINRMFVCYLYVFITPHPPSFLCSNIICSTKVYACGVYTFRNIYPINRMFVCYLYVFITPHQSSFICNIIYDCSTKVYSFRIHIFRNIYPINRMFVCQYVCPLKFCRQLYLSHHKLLENLVFQKTKACF